MNLKNIRIERNMQQKEIAFSMGVTQAVVSSWETGRRVPSGENLVKLSKVLGCTVQELINDASDVEQKRIRIATKKETEKVEEQNLDSALVSMLKELNSNQVQSVFAFVAGLKANRRE